eukprot:TRINITY_DN44_c0_g1_i2.p1 TRINITY_DN44_c0_g1~~TRINITY_DN44_c0_g1_i2.p1  ORF type:complete len:171 (-),score=49.62 TRINITY_DN44_c0_g1_i2:41-553(-)
MAKNSKSNQKKMRIEKCFFCGGPVYPGHGMSYVRNDNKFFRFCKSKCHKNFKMKRNPRKTAWTKAFRKARGKEMTNDSTLEFEKKRNRPPKYDRELWQKTVKAIKKINEIKVAREKQFYKNRMKEPRRKNALETLDRIKKDKEILEEPIRNIKKAKELKLQEKLNKNDEN